MGKTWGVILPLVILLSGCSVLGERAITSQVEEAAIAASEEKSTTQKLADKLLVEVEGRDHRNLRMCMIVAGVTELMTDRITHADPEYAAKALGQMASLRGIRSRFDSTSGIFVETDMRLALLELSSVMIDVAYDRVTNLIGNFAGGINLSGVVERGRVVARQTALLEALIRDTRNLFNVVLKEDEWSVDLAMSACEARIDANYDRVLGMLGVPIDVGE